MSDFNKVKEINSMNFEKNTLNTKTKKVRPKFYRPYRVSFNNKDAGRVINNKFSKGINKYKASSYTKLQVKQILEAKNDEYENTGEIEFADNKSNHKNISYQQRQITLSTNWKMGMDDIYNIMLENEAIPSNATCINCNNLAVLRCLDCGTKIFYCNSCFNIFHHKVNLFHRTLIFENFQIQSNDVKLPQLCEGNCEHSIIRILTITLKGWFYIQLPACDGNVNSLIKNGLFPATPCNPSLAFDFEVFELYYKLLFEAHVPYLAFCKVLEALQSKQIITQNIYHSFISSFHQYLGLKSRIQTNFRKAYKNNDNEFGCPACPQPNEENSNIIIAFDGNFQLKRLKSAGNDVENRLVNDRFIISEDNFRCWLLSNNQASTTNIHLMNNNNKSETGPTSCESNFKATNQIKSLQKFKHLDDTGIFGSTCRHGIPLKFLNLRNMGERYVLAECLIDHFQQQFSKSNQKFIFLYDIACFLDAHIANPNNILYPYRERFTWAVSIFHAYAHTSKCQQKYHPRVIKSVGLTDGESLERLWSYLGKFAKTTKYMKFGHRLDIIGTALEFHYQKSVEKLANNLFKRYKNAKKVEHESLEKLSLLNQQHNIDFKLIEETIEKQKTSEYAFKHHLEGEHAYFELLMELRSINIETTKINNIKKKELLRKKHDNILKKIENYEISLSIPKTHRWDPMDSKYSAYLEFYCINQLSKFIDGLRKERNEYLFNSSYLYNEFHKGQKLASKIKNLNANALTNINKTIENYNQTREFLSSTQKKKYLTASIKNVLDNQSNFWISLDIILDENCNIPRIIMYNAIQNFNNLNRSKEEQELVKSEITRLVIFWLEQKELIEKAIKFQEKKDGIYCNLMKELDKISLNLEIAKNMKNKIFGDDDNNQNIIYDEDFNFIEEDEEERYEEENEEVEDKEEENEEEESEEEESEEKENKEEENED
ncbi:unnamed protein product [Rhizophagus irregularis]|uniref:CxC2-like cysteine cluster KDZ transposase-associated domain-containing protein n=2 Tax=Rhizophagus irregularis TaxID=588596 RepID=A0A916E8S3_9GLOM|nr:unnamed protein product [Rhizophagus irregularis]